MVCTLFYAEQDFANMTQSVCGEFVGTCISMPGFTATNVCTYTKPSCPFKTGVKETAMVSVPVEKSFPSVSCSESKCVLVCSVICYENHT